MFHHSETAKIAEGQRTFKKKRVDLKLLKSHVNLRAVRGLTIGRVHLYPAGTESVPFAGRPSCALFSGTARVTRTEAVGCCRLCLSNSFRRSLFLECLGTSAGAPPPGSSRSNVPGPRRPVEEHNKSSTGKEYRDQSCHCEVRHETFSQNVLGKDTDDIDL